MGAQGGGKGDMNPAHKRLLVAGLLAVILVAILELFAYNVIKLDWVSFMEIQPAFQPMYDPLPVPTDSIPIEGAAYLATLEVPANPVVSDQASIERGAELFRINCMMCHGQQAMGDGPISVYLQNKPADLTSLPVQALTDGGIFLTITNGVQGKMPALNENFTVRERWDLVNYVRTLSSTGK
jgi:mono/diheme cytochrome c family protein